MPTAAWGGKEASIRGSFCACTVMSGASAGVTFFSHMNSPYDVDQRHAAAPAFNGATEELLVASDALQRGGIQDVTSRSGARWIVATVCLSSGAP